MTRMLEGKTTEDYRQAIGDPENCSWIEYKGTNKARWLVYDLCDEADALNLEINQLRQRELETIEAILAFCDKWGKQFSIKGNV